MSEFKKRLTKEWFMAATARAFWTFLQVVLSMMIMGKSILNQDWINILGVGATSVILSYGKSFIIGIPELNQEPLDGNVSIEEMSSSVFDIEEGPEEDIEC